MLERLMNQKSTVDWIEFNKREKEHKRLLMSLSKRDHIPCAFYDPNRQPVLIRSNSQKSTLSKKSSRKNSPKKVKRFEPINADMIRTRKPSRQKRSMTKKILENRKEIEQ